MSKEGKVDILLPDGASRLPAIDGKLKPGDKVVDSISTQEGRCDGIAMFKNGCVQVDIQPLGLGKDGGRKEGYFINIRDIEGFEESMIPETPDELGEVLTDRVTGITGTVICVTEGVNSGVRVTMAIRANGSEILSKTMHHCDIEDLVDMTAAPAVKEAKTVDKPNGPREREASPGRTPI